MERIERITEHDSGQSFRCGNADLDDWFAESALNSDRSGTARVYVWLGEIGDMIGYFAIVPHTVRREFLPQSVARGSPDVIPGFLLARLAVAESSQGEGNGGTLLVEALRTTLEAIRVGGGRVIVVDASTPRSIGPQPDGPRIPPPPATIDTDCPDASRSQRGSCCDQILGAGAVASRTQT